MGVELVGVRDIPADSKVRMTLKITGGTKADVVKEALRSLAAEEALEGTSGRSSEGLRAKLEERMGTDLLAKRVSAFVAARTAMPLAKEQGYSMLYAPEPANTGVIPGLFDKSYVQYDVDIVLKPSFTLSSYAPVNVHESPALVTDAMVDAQIKRELARFATYEETDDAVAEGDMIVVNMETKADGAPEPTLSGEGMRIVLSRDLMPVGFVSHVVGLNVGDHAEFEFAAIDQDNKSAVPVEFRVSLDLVDKRRRVLPELTDEFVRTRLSQTDKTVDDFRKRVRIYLSKQLREQALVRREELIDAELGSRLQGTVPDYLIERTRDEMFDSIRQNATAQGITLTEFIQQQGMDERQFQIAVAMQARESLRQGLALDALYEHLQLPLTEADYDKALAELAPGNEAVARRNFERNDAWYIVENMAQRLKAHEWACATCSY